MADEPTGTEAAANDRYEHAMSMGVQSLANQAGRLAEQVAGLNERLHTAEDTQATLASALRQLEDQQHRNASQSKFNKWVAGVTIVLLAIVAVLAFALNRIDTNADKIAANNHKLEGAQAALDEAHARLDEVQVRTSDEVLCPLYVLFIAQIDDPTAADDDEDGEVTPEEQAAFDEAVQVILDGYTALDCQPL